MNEREVLARVLHADDVSHGRAADDFYQMNEDTFGWYFDNADAILAAGFTLPKPLTAEVGDELRRRWDAYRVIRDAQPFTDAQVDAAAWAIRKDVPEADTYGFEDYRAMARAALEAAREAS